MEDELLEKQTRTDKTHGMDPVNLADAAGAPIRDESDHQLLPFSLGLPEHLAGSSSDFPWLVDCWEIKKENNECYILEPVKIEIHEES